MIPAATRNQKSLLRVLRGDERGTGAVEFALIGLLLFIVSFGIIDFGLAYWQWVMAEKATQVGVRKAVVSNMLATGLTSWPIGAGSSADGTLCVSGTTIIPDCSFSPIVCTSTAKGSAPSCSCTGGTCPTSNPVASDFDAIVTEMQTSSAKGS